MRKLHEIAVEGRIQTRSYDKDGRKVYVTEVIVQSVEFCDSKGAGKSGGDIPGRAVDDSDIPF